MRTLSSIPDSLITFSANNQPSSKSAFLYDSAYSVKAQTDFFWDTEKKDWEKSFLSLFEYNTNQQLISEKNYLYDSGIQIPVGQMIYTYSNDGDLLRQETYCRNETNDELTAACSIEYQYNTSGLPISVIEFGGKDKHGNWKPTLRYKYTYANDSVQNGIETHQYDSISNNWIYQSKQLKTLSNSSRLLSEENYTGTNDNWIKYSKNEYTYLNDLLSEEIYYRTGTNTDWIPLWKKNHIYNNNKPILESISIYNSTSSAWTEAYRDSLTYSSANILKTRNSYSNTGSQWILTRKTVYTDNAFSYENYYLSGKKKWHGIIKTKYLNDTVNRKFESANYKWDEKDSLWTPASRETKIYTNENQIKSLTKETLGKDNSWLGYFKMENEFETLSDGSIAINTTHTYQHDNSSWGETSYTQYFYQVRATSINKASTQNGIYIYWNSDKITIQSLQDIHLINVFYLNGTQKYGGTQSIIPTLGWAKGIYLVKVITRNGTRSTQKINIQ